MRLIDADALINDLEHDIAIDEDILNYVGTEGIQRETTQADKDIKQNCIDLLLHAPTIEIVRCKDCRWYKDFDGCFFSTAEVEEDGFCSYGERREP